MNQTSIKSNYILINMAEVDSGAVDDLLWFRQNFDAMLKFQFCSDFKEISDTSNSRLQLLRRFCFGFLTQVTKKMQDWNLRAKKITHLDLFIRDSYLATCTRWPWKFQCRNSTVWPPPNFKITTGKISEMPKFACNFEDPTTDEKIATTEMSLTKKTPS